MRRLHDLIAERESWLVQRVIAYARERGYAKYTSTLEEAWRASIAGLSAPLIGLLSGSAAPLELSPDDDFSSDPLSAFGVLEARRHRERGVTLPMFLGLMKYYRKSYVDLVRDAGFPREEEEEYRRILERFFDRVEVAFVTEWDRTSGEARLAELSAVNRAMTNEKNKYLTLFESLPTPAFLLDREGRIDNANLAAAELLGWDATPGGHYYAAEKKGGPLPFLSEEVSAFLAAGVPSRGAEKVFETPKGLRHYRVAMHRMLDVSGKFEGAVIILSDLTKRREAEETLQVVLDEMEARVEERTEELAGLNRALQAEIGMRRSAEEALAAQRKVLQDVVDSVPALIFIKDRENRLILVNRALAESRGVSPENMAGKPASDFFPEEQSRRFFEDDRAVIASGEPRLGILEPMNTVGGVRWYLKHKMPQRDAAGEIAGVIGIAMDVTDFQQEEVQVRTLQRAIRMTGEYISALLRIRDESTMLSEICRVVVEEGGYRIAWVGYAEDEPGKTVRPVAHWGCEEGFPGSQSVIGSDEERGCGPAGTAIRTGKPVVARQIPSDPTLAPLRGDAVRMGYASIAAIPLRDGERTLGAISVYASEPDAFGEEETRFLSVLANALAYSIRVIRAREERRREEKRRAAL